MATKWCDHGLYPAYSGTPTFGTCQDGDGSAIGAASAATVSIDLTAYSAAAGNSVTIGGALLTCVASAAGANQFNAGSGATLAANLAAAINQTSNTNTIATTSASNPMMGWPTNTKLQDMLYAVATGAILDIQTRPGSAAFNASTFFAVVSAGLTGGTLNNQFAGGASGAWGYVFNHSATIWKSALAIASYGIWGANKPFAGTLDGGDLVKIRSAKTLSLVSNTNVTWTMAAMGSASSPVTFEIDDSTTWADGANPIFKIFQPTPGSTSMRWTGLNTTFAHIKAKQYASGQRNTVLEVGQVVGSSIAAIRVTAGAQPIRFDNIDFFCPGTSATSTQRCQIELSVGGSMSQNATTLFNCRFHWPTHNNGDGGFSYTPSGLNGSGRIKLIRCDFVQADATIGQSPVMGISFGGGVGRWEIEECRWIGLLGTSRFISAGSITRGTTVALKNCDLGAIKHRGPNVAISASTEGTTDGVWAFSKYGNRDFTLDTRPGFVEWNSTKGYPTLSAKLLDGVTGWVWFAAPTTAAGNISRIAPFELPAINKYNSLATSNRTATVNIALESTLVWTRADISMQVSYLDSAGATRTVDTFDATGSALTADTTSTWSSEVAGQVTYNGQTFNKYQFSVLCPDMANGCEVTFTPRIHTSVANETLGTFINPDFTVI